MLPEQHSMRRASGFMKMVVSVGLLAMVAADQPAEPTTAKEALTQVQWFVGDWRGSGQVKRGSPRGSWLEACGWSWKFGDQVTALTFKIEDAKFFRDGELQWNAKSKQYELAARGLKEGESVTYTGELSEDGRLVLEASDVPDELPARLSFRQVAGGNRLIVLYERRLGPKRFLRMAEVGYTRSGSNFGRGTNFIECVVTGGVGTIEVRHEGKKYYVCCTGCKEYFDSDPAGALAEYRERKAEEKREAEQKSQKQG